MIIPSDGILVMRFYRTFVHILTASEIDYGYLVVPWFGFGEDALPTTVTQLSIIDHYGNIWKCDMIFIRMENTIFCRIGGDWRLLSAARRLVKGHAIKLVVTENTRNGYFGGTANRKVDATHMNCESSRSHSVFTCIIES
ncbi:kinesin motor domain protein [Medicago truncatula]|uniref:Kinesin motor domain protein n=1 Tax=Medicago truncatula TaxID=3880 RepID=G7I6H7_MEDTR|nr:kinesin motor domain protein [Medicago truncatula]